jgi:hypothetical protein
VIGDKSGDCRARVEDGPDEGLNAEGLQKLKVTVASVSNPGVHAHVHYLLNFYPDHGSK